MEAADAFTQVEFEVRNIDFDRNEWIDAIDNYDHALITLDSLPNTAELMALAKKALGLKEKEAHA